MCIQYLPWVLGIWRTVDKMNKTPALREVHPQHLANQQKSRLKSVREKDLDHKSEDPGLRERESFTM